MTNSVAPDEAVNSHIFVINATNVILVPAQLYTESVNFKIRFYANTCTCGSLVHWSLRMSVELNSLLATSK